MPRLPDGQVEDAGRRRRPTDLRAVLLGGSAWAGGLVALGLPGWSAAALLGAAVGALAMRGRRGRPVITLSACLVAAVAVGGVSAARAAANAHSAVGELAGRGAVVTVHARVVSDPVVRRGRFGDYTLTRLSVRRVEHAGRWYETSVPVLAIADREWRDVELGSMVSADGRLGPPQGEELAAVLSTSRAATVLAAPADLFEGAAGVRMAIRDAVARAPAAGRDLVPALVVGDDARLPPEVVEDFKTCGLTHLTAVSGTNLTLVVGFLLILARWLGVRARGLTVVGAVGVVGFVLLARPEPSVLRAAAMGSVALLGMGARGRDQGARALGVAVFALLLVDPWLVRSVGFALSSLATAGILFLGPPFRDALRRWLPRWAAEAIAVPFAAQLACTPVVAAISGQVSLVAVVANLLAAVAVGPATVLGLLGGLLHLVSAPVGRVCGWLAGGCAWWIVAVATRLARLPTAALDWSSGPVSITVLAIGCAGVALVGHRVLGRGRWSVALALVLLVVMLRPLPSPGWPPRGWLMVACDVGQGDGLVLNAGDGAAVVVDAGPEPQLMDRCLDRLDVRVVPVVVLTHFHADHVDGLPGVLDGREVGRIEVTALAEPAGGARQVGASAAAARIPLRTPEYGETRRVGDVTWQVVGPRPSPPTAFSAEAEANNASVVLLVAVRGTRLLLGGDMEPEAQQALDGSLADLRVDVLKVPHHGSRYQRPQLLTGLGARVAVVSAGADNDYGHPAPSTVALLRGAGMVVARTDEQGDVAVVLRDGQLRVQGSR